MKILLEMECTIPNVKGFYKNITITGGVKMPTKFDEFLVRWVDLKNGTFNEKEVSSSFIKDWLNNKDHIQILHKEYVRTVSLV